MATRDQGGILHVCFVTANYPRFPGGGAKVIYEHANRLAALGHRVEIVHPLSIRHRGVGRVLDKIRNKIRDLRFDASPKHLSWVERDPKVRVHVVERLDVLSSIARPDVYVATFWSTTDAIEKHGLGAPTLQFMQAYESWAAGPDEIRRVWGRPWDKAVISRALHRQGLQLGVPDSLLHLVPNGLDTSTYHPTRPVSGRPPHVAFLAHTARVKGLDIAIEVARLIHAVRPLVPLTAFGGSRRPPELPPYVRYLQGLTGRDLVDEVYDQCSVFLCTSRLEGWGYPSMEAMACGAALVSTDNGGVVEFSENGVSSVIAPVEDARALASAVIRLLDHADERDRVADAGVRSVGRFTWAASSAAFEAALVATIRRQDEEA